MSNAPRKRSRPASSEKPHGDFNWPPTNEELAQYSIETMQRETAFDSPAGDEDPTRSDAEDPKHSGIEDSATPGTAVSQRQTARDGTSAGETAAEIAHLQALIEGLTQKLDVSARARG